MCVDEETLEELCWYDGLNQAISVFCRLAMKTMFDILIKIDFLKIGRKVMLFEVHKSVLIYGNDYTL